MSFFYIKNIIYITLVIIDKFYNKYLLNKKIHWSINYSRVYWNKIGSKKIYKIKNPKNKWFADPQIIKKNKDHFIFFEDYSTITKKGAISCIRINKNNKKKYYENILVENHHLSFPFIFRYKSCYYLIPETSEINMIKIYKCIKFPNKWIFYKKLFRSKSVDHIIFKSGKFWYLFNNEKNFRKVYSKLVGYVSQNPLSNKWKRTNILKNSLLFGRNAGYFEDKKNSYRVCQSYLPGRYGAGIFINRINKITNKSYDEIVEKKYFPNIFSKIKGIHTLDSVDNFTVFDSSKWQS